MSTIYSGYVYIWYDTKSKFFYIGGHKGKIEDRYICSNKAMKHAYLLRPNTFKFKVLEYVTDYKLLRLCEQKWLNMIKDSELMTTENIKNKTCKYYNVKKISSGGNGSANKGKSHIAWNKGLTKSDPRVKLNYKNNPNTFVVTYPNNTIYKFNSIVVFSNEININPVTIYKNLKSTKKISKGPLKDWKFESEGIGLYGSPPTADFKS